MCLSASIKVKLPRWSAILGSSIIWHCSRDICFLFNHLIWLDFVGPTAVADGCAGGQTPQPLPAPTDPPNRAPRIPDHKGKVRHVASYDGAGPYHGPAADNQSRQNRCICSNGAPST